MLIALTQLLFCQLMGEVIARAFDLAIPGPVIGMSLLLVCTFISAIDTGALGDHG